MIKPLDTRFAACYYDGVTPIRHNVEVDLDTAGIGIVLAGCETIVWPYPAMRIATDGSYGEPIRIERDGQTLVVESSDFIEAMRQHGAANSAIRVDLRGWPAVLFCCIAIAVIASALYVWGVKWTADQAARFMPAGLEDRLGRSVATVLAPAETRCLDATMLRNLEPVLDRLRIAAGSK